MIEQAADKPGKPDRASTSGLMADYMRNRSTLRVFLLNRTRCPSDADDLLQDLYMKIVGRDVNTHFSNPTAYLFSMAANLSIDLQRRQKRERLYSEQVSPQGNETPALSPSSEEEFRAQQTLNALSQAIRSMPAKQRSVFMMHRFEHMTHKQIAEMLGISVKMVEKHMTQALGRCRRTLSDSWPGGGQ